FRVAEARTGCEAIRLAVALRPVAVLLDLVLPELDGWEVARRLRENDATSAAAIIALTAAVLPSDHERARAAGCDMVLTKPVLPRGSFGRCVGTSACRSPPPLAPADSRRSLRVPAERAAL